MKPVIQVARSGYSLEDDVNYHTLDTRFNTLKVKTEYAGTASVTTQVDYVISVTHNLGYKPFVLFYFKHPDTDKWYLAPAKVDSGDSSSSGWVLNGVYQHYDANTVKFKLYDNLTGSGEMPSSPTDVDYKYYIFIDPRKDVW